MKKIFCVFIISTATFLHGEFIDHLKPVSGPRAKTHQIAGIDYIYLINLDKRPEKLENSLAQLAPYGVVPHRFSAVCGWDLPLETLNEVGVKFAPGMLNHKWVFHPSGNSMEMEFLQEKSFGKTVFSKCMSLGAIGCSLSHLSILQDAYNANYETIWVLEDDFLIKHNIDILSEFIKKLDALIGKDNWDVLYTDTDNYDTWFYGEQTNFESDLTCNLWFFWRPNADLSDSSKFTKRSVLSEDFVKIGSRMHTHSMIIRRSGMKKILDYIKTHHLFVPYDHELATIPDIQLINLRQNIVSFDSTFETSDIRHSVVSKKSEWNALKQSTINELNQLSGWHNPQQSEKLMEFVYEKKPAISVEIGAFGGCSTYPIANTLSFLKTGKVYAIDAWDTNVAIDGLNDPKVLEWWKSLNMLGIYQHFENFIKTKELENYCHLIHAPSNLASKLFGDNSIDFLYLDGNESEKGSLEDTVLYFPKVREGGYIWLTNGDSPSKAESVAYLMKNCDWIREDSLEIRSLVFKKREAPPPELPKKTTHFWDVLKDFFSKRPIPTCKHAG